MVMHARKPQRVSDGHFEKYQTHPYQSTKYGGGSSSSSSKRDYERESAGGRSSGYMRNSDRSNLGSSSSPMMGTSSAGIMMNGSGGSSYNRSASPDHLDSPSRDRDRDRSDRYSMISSSSYTQKMRDKERSERDLYKKDKYLDKRERRDRESEHRTNHDRLDQMAPNSRRSSSGKSLCPSQSAGGGVGGSMMMMVDKRAGSIERDGSGRCGGGSNSDRERVTRIGDWSEHVSSSGKKYYYNCKTEVSQWEKPRDWLDKERSVSSSKESHHSRDYRDKDRERGRDDRFSRSNYGKHSSSSSSRSSGAGGGSSSSSRRIALLESELGVQSSSGGGVGSGGGGSSASSHHHYHQSSSSRLESSSRRRHGHDPLDGVVGHNQDMDISPDGGDDSTPTSEGNYSHMSTPTRQNSINNRTSGVADEHHHHHHHHQQQQQQHHHSTNNGSSSNSSGSTSVNQSQNSSSAGLMVNALPRLASHPGTAALNSANSGVAMSPSNVNNHHHHLGVHHHQGHHQSVHHLQKSGKMLNDLNQSSPGGGIVNSNCNSGSINSGSSNNLISNCLDGSGGGNGSSGGPTVSVSLANLPKILSQITGNKQIDQTELNPQKALQTINNALLMSSRSGGNHPYNNNGMMMATAGISPANTTTTGSYMSGSGVDGLISSSQLLANLANNGGDNGRITPTQDIIMDHRKLVDYNSCSGLQGVMTSQLAQRTLGPSLTPSLSNYFRADLIAHVTNWPADILEKQAQKCSEEAHILGDLQCTRVSAELKIARSLVRITEITATLQEQKVMYLRQQIQRLEDLKSQNSFMSDDL